MFKNFSRAFVKHLIQLDISQKLEKYKSLKYLSLSTDCLVWTLSVLDVRTKNWVFSWYVQDIPCFVLLLKFCLKFWIFFLFFVVSTTNSDVQVNFSRFRRKWFVSNILSWEGSLGQGREGGRGQEGRGWIDYNLFSN